jgi:molecular chaperone DnaK
MEPLIGIDLGTTYSCLAGMVEGAAKVIPNLEGSPTTPSMVCLTSTGETLVGNPALRQSLTNPERTLFAAKRLIGQKFRSERVQEARRHLPYTLIEAANGDVQMQVDGRPITPQEVSSQVLGYLKKSAEAYFGTAVREAVLTVPAHFDDNQRQATKDAALIAGLDVMRIINEPTAASLAYGLHRKRSGRVAVFDMGGGTFDITLLEINDGVFHVLATAGDSYLGGEDFDQRLVDWLLSEFSRETGEDLGQDKYALQRIKEAAERAKRELSFARESEINLPFIASAPSGSSHLRRTLTRPLLEELTRDLVERAFPLIEQVLGEAALRPDQVESVLLVGGQTRMPLLRHRVADYFGRPPDDHLNPDEGVALGAAIQAGILTGEMSDIVLLLDVTSLSLGIETEGGGFERIIEKNATIPVRRSKPFTTVENEQRRVRIHVLQGESPKADENASLGMFDLVGIAPVSAGVAHIEVTFEIDANGMVRVSARDAASGREQKMVVEPASGLSREQKNEIMERASARNTTNGQTRLL